MKTKRLLFLLTGVIVACNQGAFDTGLNGAIAQRQSTYADCKAALYQAPQRIISGQLNCPNPCLYTHEGFINFKENRVQLNCQQYPLHSPGFLVCIDSTRSINPDGSANKQIMVVTKNYAAWCQDEAFRFYQLYTNAKPTRIWHLEEGDPSYGSVGYLIFEMGEEFWRSFDPAKPFVFRFMAQKPLKLPTSTLLPL